MNPVPKADSVIGIEGYATTSPGLGGVLRRFPEDFVVEEVFEEVRYEGGRYLIAEVEKTNWDTHRMIRELSRALRISQKRITWAGTKDKHAVTRQRISIMNLEEDALDRVNLSGIRLKVLGRTNRALGLGDLQGNRFAIRIRDIGLDRQETESRLRRITSEIEEIKGVPNYFGVQRFGDVRPVTHLVGEALVKGDPELAVFTYLARSFPGELPESRAAREELWEGRDVSKALKRYPPHLHYEAAILNHLRQNEGDYSGAFDVLTPNLRRLFVHAYQSYLFNRMLSRRLDRGLPLSTALTGDVVCFTREGRPDVSRLQRVDEENLEAVNRLSARGKACVTVPLLGYETDLSGGLQGEIEQEVLEEEGVSPEDFLVPENPSLGSPGTRRAALLTVSPKARVEETSVLLEFFLPRGSYATVVLREYIKA